MELMTVQETAAILKVSPVTVRRYISSGRLAAVRIGRSIRVDREAVEKLPEPVEEKAPPPVKKSRKRRKTGILTWDDPLWKLVGMAVDDDGPTDVASNKHKYLADGYLELHTHNQ